MKSNYRYIKEKKIYEYRFTYQGQRLSVYGSSTKECEEKADEKKKYIREHYCLDMLNITLDEYYKLWFEELKKVTKPSTQYNYEKKWKGIQPILGKKKVREITKKDVMLMTQKLDKSPNAINGCLKLLRQILTAAMKDRIIVYNPAMNVNCLKVEKSDAAETVHRALTQEETKKFLDRAKDTHYYWLYQFMLNTGVRISEALALTWDDIKAEISITKTMSKVGDKEYALMDTPKSDCSNRTIPITKNVKEILKQQKRQNILLFDNNTNVFLNTRGEIPTYNAVNQTIVSITERINIKPFTSHAFRDTFATRAVESGMNPLTLKKLMGHSSIKITMDIYAHVMPETKKNEMNKIRLFDA